MGFGLYVIHAFSVPATCEIVWVQCFDEMHVARRLTAPFAVITMN